MAIHNKSSVLSVEKKLTEKYTNLVEVFSGSPYAPKHPEPEHEVRDRVVIDGSELRMAVDEFSAILKEVRRYTR